MSEVVRIGILSTASIGDAILQAISETTCAECTVIASRTVAKARIKCAKYNIPNAVTYEELLTTSSSLIDAVYIPLPTTMTTEWAIRFARSGKHVLLEKPFTNSQAVLDIMSACDEQGVICLDGTHFVHALRTKEVNRMINKECKIGKIRSMYVPFHAPICDLMDNIRGDDSLEPLGVLGDLGWYSVRSVIAFLGIDYVKYIKDITVIPEFRENRILESIMCTILFESADGETLTLMFNNMFRSCIWQRVEIIGTMGTIVVPDFVVPRNQTWCLNDLRPDKEYTTELTYTIEKTVSSIKGIDGFESCFPKVETIKVIEKGRLSQVAAMVNEFCGMVRQNDVQKSHEWMKESFETMKILDAVFERVVEFKKQL